MSCTRRTILLAGLGLLAAGCETTTRQATTSRTFWPTSPSPQTVEAANRGLVPKPYTRSAFGPGGAAQPAAAVEPTRTAGLQVIPRSQWTRSGPIVSRINTMNGVQRITVHHEGWTSVQFSDSARTAQRIEQIRRVHTDAPRGWGDIGYHYIVDRAGRVWEGRAVAYQGAHVKEQNEHNLGILVLGNFEQQSPTDAQLSTLAGTLQSLQSQYRVSVGEVYTHRELNPTACPGRFLQPSVDVIRSRYL